MVPFVLSTRNHESKTLRTDVPFLEEIFLTDILTCDRLAPSLIPPVLSSIPVFHYNMRITACLVLSLSLTATALPTLIKPHSASGLVLRQLTGHEGHDHAVSSCLLA